MKKDIILRADLHCHTHLSFDGFTTSDELLRACKIKNINTIAITEHDLICKINKHKFRKNNVFVIDGCEFTTDKGAHIIGLFVRNLISNGTYKEIIEHIKKENGIILIPHPFKPKSGVCKVYNSPFYIFEKADFIELFNGGYMNSNYEKKKIIEIAKKYNLKLIANSDSHKINQFGYYITIFKTKNEKTIKKALLKGKTEFFIDQALAKPPRKIKKFQNYKLYQLLLKTLPYKLRRFLKLILYFFTNKKIKASNYKKIY